MGLVVYPQQLPDQVLLAKTLQPVVPQQLPSQWQGVNEARRRSLKRSSQVQVVQSPSQQPTVEASDVMSDDQRATEHLKESDEGHHHLFEGVGEDEPMMEEEPLPPDLKARDSGCSSLNTTPGDDVEVE